MREFFTELQIFSGKLIKEIPKNPAVMRAGRRTHIQDTLYIQEHYRNRRFRYDTHIQLWTESTGIGGGKGLSLSGFWKDIAVSPNILLYKLTEIIRNNDIKSVSIVRMEVPCCGGLAQAAKTALQNSGKFIPWQVVTVSIDGNILD